MSGLTPALAWAFLATIALGVAAQVAGDHYDQRLRLARRLERRLSAIEQAHLERHNVVTTKISNLRKELDEQKAVLTPDGAKHLHNVVERMARDLGPIKEEWDSMRAAGGLRAMIKR